MKTRPRAPAATTLAAFCAGLRWDALPAAARARTLELVLDLLGVAVRGSAAASSRVVQRVVAEQPAGEVPVLGTVRRSTAAWAALANAAAAHATEMDDVTNESSLHPGVVVIPAALALARERRASPRTALEAIAAGYEVTIRVGNALNAESAYRRGFHPTGVAGVVGAAVSAGRVLGLDGAGLERAIGIAGTMASGSLEYLADGAWTKRLNPGWAAHGGIVAASLAAAGFSGPRTALEGEHGLLRGYTDDPRPERLLEGLDVEDLQLMHVSIKPYGCCRYCHPIIDAVLELRRAHRIRPADVASLRLGVLSAGWSLIADPPERVRDPRNTVDAQFSAPYAAAVALARGRAGLAEFREEALADPEVRSLLAHVECVRDDSLDAEYPRRWPANVEARLVDGRALHARIEHALGDPENPLPRAALIDRFTELVGTPDSASLAERILSLERASDLSVLDDLQRASDEKR